ncbi:MAG: lipid-A-disaccharide synthase N-terminal domain-containing protein [Candidatus Altiarchaeota archaeon]
MLALSFKPEMVLGFLGGLMLFASWIVQMIESLNKKESVVTLKFWILRFLGAFLLLIYSVLIRDIVFILVNFVTSVIFAVNISLNFLRHRK